MGDGASGCFRTSDPTDFASADAASLGAGTDAGDGDSGFGAASVAAGAEVGSVLNTLMPAQLSSTATAPRISSSARLFKRRRTGARGGPFELISTRITNWGVGGAPDWDLAAAGSGIADRAGPANRGNFCKSSTVPQVNLWQQDK